MRAELEAAIVAAPDDPAPRAVYADWLIGGGDAAGDRELGEWVALATADDAERAAGARTREIAVGAGRHLADHARALLGGPGRALMRPGHFGFRGGFIDELRLQVDRGAPPLDDAPGALADLLARPIARFVHRIALGGGFRAATDMIATIAAARLPLLAELVAIDADEVTDPGACDVGAAVAAHAATLRVLALRHVRCTAPPPPQLRVLHLCATAPAAWGWIADHRCPALEELWIDGPLAGSALQLARDLANLPALRGVRAYGIGGDTGALVTRLQSLPALAHREVAARPLREPLHVDDLTAFVAQPPAVRRIPALGAAILAGIIPGAAREAIAREEAGIALAELAFELAAPPTPASETVAFTVYRRLAAHGRWIDAEAFVTRHRDRLDLVDRAIAAVEIARATDRIDDAVSYVLQLPEAALAWSPELAASAAVVHLRADRPDDALDLINRYDAGLRLAAARDVLVLAYLVLGEPARARAAFADEDAPSALHLHARAALEAAAGDRQAALATLAALAAAHPHALDRGWVAVDPLLGSDGNH